MEVSYEQLAASVGAVFTILTGAIGAFAVWANNKFNKQEERNQKCDEKTETLSQKLLDVTEKASKLEGQLLEVSRFSPDLLVTQIVDLLEKKRSTSKGKKKA